MRVTLLLALTACSSTPAPSAPSTPTPPNAPAAVSLDQIEQLARGCAQPAAATEIYALASWKAGAWSAEARAGDQTFAIDLTASTCNGATIATTATGGASLEEVVTIARQCHQADAPSLTVSYLAGEGGVLDRSRFEVVFAEPGPGRTFPAPSFIVDPATKTCGPPRGPVM